MDDLIKCLAEVSLYLCNEAGREDYSDTVEQACDELAKQQWISVEERMPEERESIFARFKGTDKWSPAMFAQSSDDVRVVVVFADGTRVVSHSHTIDGKWECEKRPVKRTVTHWMPNPDLPTQKRKLLRYGDQDTLRYGDQDTLQYGDQDTLMPAT